MNKELEEAIRVIKENQEDRKKILESKAFSEYIIEGTQQDYDRNQAILDYIDNSVSKDKIKELLEKMRKNGSNYWADEVEKILCEK